MQSFNKDGDVGHCNVTTRSLERGSCNVSKRSLERGCCNVSKRSLQRLKKVGRGGLLQFFHKRCGLWRWVGAIFQ